MERKLTVTLIPDEGIKLRDDLLPYLSIVISHALPGIEARVGNVTSAFRPDAEVKKDAGHVPGHWDRGTWVPPTTTYDD